MTPPPPVIVIDDDDDDVQAGSAAAWAGAAAAREPPLKRARTNGYLASISSSRREKQEKHAPISPHIDVERIYTHQIEHIVQDVLKGRNVGQNSVPAQLLNATVSKAYDLKANPQYRDQVAQYKCLPPHSLVAISKRISRELNLLLAESELQRLDGNHLASPTNPSSITLSAQPLPQPPKERSPQPRQSTPTRPLKPLGKLSPHVLSPQNIRSRARAAVFKTGSHEERDGASTSTTSTHPYFRLPSLPYEPYPERRRVAQGIRMFVKTDPALLPNPYVYHVDFHTEEIKVLHRLARDILNAKSESKHPPAIGLSKLLRKKRNHRPCDLVDGICKRTLEHGLLPRRSSTAVRNFLFDMRCKGNIVTDNVLRIEKDLDGTTSSVTPSRISSLLFAREIAGSRISAFDKGWYQNTKNEFKKTREDSLELKAQWTNCAGDIHTISWVSSSQFICGTTAHSDHHNQQYNKPGNLLLGSSIQGTLRAYPNHRILRPVVAKGENASHEMRESQDPYLYTTVCHSAYDPLHNLAYTCGYDETVKIWKVNSESMTCCGTWKHDGKVNFVVVSKSGMVATAADVALGAVRVYQHAGLSDTSIENQSYRTYSCRRIGDVVEDVNREWAYCPASIQWGLCPDVQQLLLVGYSPRSVTKEIREAQIPDEKLNTGEIALWNCLTGERLKVNTASNANVFEVVWHPSQPCFLVATSPALQTLRDSHIRTQIHIYRPADATLDPNALYGSYSVIKTLDCGAVDINEIAVMPNSFSYCYVTAACTDGNVYVWDTTPHLDADAPRYILPHGEPVEELDPEQDRAVQDVGVKFVAWGKSLDRIYTGSTDGVVKVWNIRDERPSTLRRRYNGIPVPDCRDLLEAPGAITVGAFSPDHSKLVVGDATGRVSLLSVDEDDDMINTVITIPGTHRRVRPPRSFIPHPDPPKPDHDAEGKLLIEETGISISNKWLQSGIMQMSRVGAVQGPNYKQLGLYCRTAHMNENPNAPLTAEFMLRQRSEAPEILYRDLKKAGLEPSSRRQEDKEYRAQFIAHNDFKYHYSLANAFDAKSLEPTTKAQLLSERAILELEENDFGFEYDDDEDGGDEYWNQYDDLNFA